MSEKVRIELKMSPDEKARIEAMALKHERGNTTAWCMKTLLACAPIIIKKGKR